MYKILMLTAIISGSSHAGFSDQVVEALATLGISPAILKDLATKDVDTVIKNHLDGALEKEVEGIKEGFTNRLKIEFEKIHENINQLITQEIDDKIKTIEEKISRSNASHSSLFKKGNQQIKEIEGKIEIINENIKTISKKQEELKIDVINNLITTRIAPIDTKISALDGLFTNLLENVDKNAPKEPVSANQNNGGDNQKIKTKIEDFQGREDL